MKIIIRNEDFHLEQSEDDFPCQCYEFTIKNMVKENGFNQEISNKFDDFFEKNDYYKSLQYSTEKYHSKHEWYAIKNIYKKSDWYYNNQIFTGEMLESCII